MHLCSLFFELLIAELYLARYYFIEILYDRLCCFAKVMEAVFRPRFTALPQECSFSTPSYLPL